MTANGALHTLTSSAYLNHSIVLIGLNRSAEAEDFLHKALEIREQAHGPNHDGTLKVRNRLCFVLLIQDDKESEAERFCSETLTLIEKHLDNSHPEYFVALENLAAIRLSKEQVDDALALLEPSEPLMRRALAAGSFGEKEAARYLLRLGTAYAKAGAFHQAESALLDANRLFEAVVDFERMEDACVDAIKNLYEQR